MNICINYYGQPRGLKVIEKNFYDNIYDNKNNFHILYTTWVTENTDDFKKVFNNSFIKKYEVPDMNDYIDIIQNYSMDGTQVNGIENYLKYLIIKNNSLQTIIEYEKNNNLKFDIIITMRPDHIFYGDKISDYYDYFITKKDYIFIPCDPCYDIYGEGAYQCSFSMCNNNNINKILSKIKIIKYLTLNNQNVFHPETTGFKLLLYYNLKYEKINFICNMIR